MISPIPILLHSQKLQIVRKKDGDYSSTTGKWVEGTSETIEINAALIPFALSEETIDKMEGTRFDSQYNIWSTKEIKADDNIVYRDENYRVMVVYNRSYSGYWKAVIKRRHDSG